MKTLELLAVSESVVGAKDTSGRYRLPRRSLLPRFGSPKNPFASPAEPEGVRGEQVEPVEKTPPPKPVVAVAAPVPKAAVKSEPLPKTAKQSSLRGEWIQRLWAWIGALNPRRWRLRIKVAPKAGPFRRVGTPVQGELSLDNVRVLRNDLRDSDLEVVPLRSSVKRPNLSLAAVEPHKAPRMETWNRLTARLLHAGQTSVH